MKTKKLLFAVAFSAVALLSGYNFVQNNNEIKLSDLVLANVEALANGENSGDSIWYVYEYTLPNGTPAKNCVPCGSDKC